MPGPGAITVANGEDSFANLYHIANPKVQGLITPSGPPRIGKGCSSNIKDRLFTLRVKGHWQTEMMIIL